MIKNKLMKRLHPHLAKEPYQGAQGLILSVSGGMDSMVMLDVFLRMKHVHGATLRVVHIHHGTGVFADQSQQLVVGYCRERQIPVQVFQFQKPDKGNFEYEAAAFRRQALETERKQQEWILLAHHLQDQAETCLLTLARGAGITTPIGMSAQHDGRLRPFLDLDQKLLREHASQCKVPFVEDPSNRDIRFFRNRVRHKILPQFRAVYEGVAKQLSGFMGELAQLRLGLQAEAERIFKDSFVQEQGLLARSAFENSPAYLWDFLLKLFWERCASSKPKRAQHQQLLAWLNAREQGCFDHGGQRFWCDHDGLVLEPAPAKKPQVAAFGVPVQWGPWLFSLHGRAWDPRTFTVLPRSSLPHREKEYLRVSTIPLRIRANLPRIQIGEKSETLRELLQSAEPVVLNAIYPPNLCSYLAYSRIKKVNAAGNPNDL